MYIDFNSLLISKLFCRRNNSEGIESPWQRKYLYMRGNYLMYRKLLECTSLHSLPGQMLPQHLRSREACKSQGWRSRMAQGWFPGIDCRNNTEQSPLAVTTAEPLGSAQETGDDVLRVDTAWTTWANPQQKTANIPETRSLSFMYVGNIGETQTTRLPKGIK